MTLLSQQTINYFKEIIKASWHFSDFSRQPHTSWADSTASRRLNYNPSPPVQTDQAAPARPDPVPTRPNQAVDVARKQAGQQRQLINYSNSIELGHVEQLEAGAEAESASDCEATPEKRQGTCCWGSQGMKFLLIELNLAKVGMISVFRISL